jgi:arabinofuranosyltransferase
MTDGTGSLVSKMMARPWVYALVAVVILLAHQAFYYRDLGRDAVDDAYISFRYADNLVAGHGLVFNPGERVEGYTNFLWTVLLALFMRMGVSASASSIVLGGAFGLATLWLVYRFCQMEWPDRPVVAVVGMLCLAVDGSFALWAVSGMETSMFSFLVLAAVTCHVWEWKTDKPGFLSGAVAALAAMTRPEGLLVFVVLMGHQLLARLVVQRRLPVVADVAKAGAFVTLYLPYYLWRYYYYGFLLPNTFYAKVAVGDATAQIRRGLSHTATFGRLHLSWLLPLIAAVPIVKRRISFWLTACLAVLLTYMAYITYVGGDWSVGRFFVPILPLSYVLVATGLVELYDTAKGWLSRRAVSSRALRAFQWSAAACLLLGLTGLFNSSSLEGEHKLFVARFQAAKATHARVTMGKWLRDNVPADTYIAVDAAGQIPYYSGLRTLDMFGVNDVHTAHTEVEKMGEGVPGHEKFDFDYIMWRQPDLIIATAAFLDGSESYERLEVQWTEDLSLDGFLYVYRRRGWNGWP